MTWPIRALVKKCPIWDKFCNKPLTNLSFSREAFVVSIRNTSPYVGESTSAASSRLELYISRGNIYQNECRSKIWNYTWFVWPFYALIDFYMHYLTCTIQIWTTITRSSASKWIENNISVHASLGSHARYGNEFQTSRGLGSVTKTLRNYRVLNHVNQKLVRRFMKLGMVSWTWHIKASLHFVFLFETRFLKYIFF